MGDPLSVASGIIATLQLAATTTKYLKDLRSGSSDRTKLRDELRNLVCLVEMLQDRVDDMESGVQDTVGISMGHLASPEGPIAQFQKLLEDISGKLRPRVGGLQPLAQSVAWPFDKKAVQEMLNTVERLKGHFHLVIQNDLVALSKLANAKIDKLEDKIDSTATEMQRIELQKIMVWISPLSFGERHVSVLESVQPGSGKWFLEHSAFVQWVEGRIDRLWCPGIPGAGKTRLMSLAIDHLQKRPHAAHNGHMFVYCDFDQRSNQSALALVSSMVRQILQQQHGDPAIPEILSLYRGHQTNNTRPTLVEMTKILSTLVSHLDQAHIIIDALDEHSEREEESLDFLSVLQSLGSRVKILCTSRPATSLQSAYFKKWTTITIFAHEGDIRLFLENRINQRHRLQRHVQGDPDLKDEIIHTIVQESQGMFLLAKLHIESLLQKINRRQVRSALRTLPTTLDDTYTKALARIHSQGSDIAELAEMVLFWTVCAHRALTIAELQHIYATQDLAERAPLEDDDLPDPESLMSACGGLVTVNGDPQRVYVVHYTAQEFLERCHAPRLLVSRLSLTVASLTYLCLPNFADGVCRDDDLMAKRLHDYPFIDYAAKHWGSNLGGLDFSVIEPWVRLVAGDRTATAVTNQAFSVRNNGIARWSQDFPRDVPFVVLAASFNVPGVLEMLIRDGCPIDKTGTDGETALIRASSAGRAENVAMLLENGASVDARDNMDETALFKASKAGNSEVITILIQHKASVNGQNFNGLTALIHAVSSGNLDAVKLLVTAGADLGRLTRWGDSALSIATRTGHESIASYLFDQGATLPPGPAGRRSTLAASRKGLHQLVRQLTLNYEAVAKLPLQRQGPRLIPVESPSTAQHTSESAEQSLVPGTDTTDAQSSEPAPMDNDETSSDIDTGERFLEALEVVDYNVGFHKRYASLKPIGKGHTASILLCLNRVTYVHCAAKVFTKPGGSAKWREFYLNVRSELQALRDANHPSILRLIDAFAEPDDEAIYLVTELATEGELFNFIVTKEKLTEDETRRIFSQLFAAVQYLHELGWVHRDVKPENILLFDKNFTIKLADFGLSKKIGTKDEGGALTTTLCGTPSYVAPEVLVAARERAYDHSVDVWSCGVVLYICLCGFPPFSDELYSEDFPYKLSDQIKSGRFDYPSPYWDSVGDPALDLIDLMLVVDPAERYSIQRCLQHPWMIGAVRTVVEDAVLSSDPEQI